MLPKNLRIVDPLFLDVTDESTLAMADEFFLRRRHSNHVPTMIAAGAATLFQSR